MMRSARWTAVHLVHLQLEQHAMSETVSELDEGRKAAELT
jgi:hypothetical protein